MKNLMIFLSIFLGLICIVSCVEHSITKDDVVKLKTGDVAKFGCAKSTAFDMLKYDSVGDASANTADKVVANTGTWTCSADYGKEATKAKDAIKEGDIFYAKASPLFECATAGTAQIMCQILRNSSNMVNGSSGLIFAVIAIFSAVTLFMS